jgi:hypothetical protein
MRADPGAAAPPRRRIATLLPRFWCERATTALVRRLRSPGAMTMSRRVWGLLPLALVAGATGGCWGTNCGPHANPTLAPGDTYEGVDPRAALAALVPQTMTLTWVRTDETTTLTVATAAADEPSEVRYDCGGDPEEFIVPARLAVRTAAFAF